MGEALGDFFDTHGRVIHQSPSLSSELGSGKPGAMSIMAAAGAHKAEAVLAAAVEPVQNRGPATGGATVPPLAPAMAAHEEPPALQPEAFAQAAPRAQQQLAAGNFADALRALAPLKLITGSPF